MGGWGPGRQAASSGGQSVVSRWLLVLLVESGAGVRAALASASREGALEGSLLVLAPLPVPFLAAQRSQAGFGSEPRQGRPPGLWLQGCPWCPRTLGLAGVALGSGLVRAEAFAGC